MANSHSIRFINASITIGLLSLVVSLPGHRAATRFGAWPQLERGAWVEQRYEAASARLAKHYAALVDAVIKNAPELLVHLRPGPPILHGYQILPRIAADAAVEKHAHPVAYSWPWTERLIDRVWRNIIRSETELRRAAAMSAPERSEILARLAQDYEQLSRRQRNVHAHVEYNRLWQAAIAKDRARYDRETALYGAIVERQKILDGLERVQSRFGISRAFFNRPGRLAELNGPLRQREALLGRRIEQAMSDARLPAFVQIEQLANEWIFRVPLVTDIEDRDYVRAVKEIIETAWRLKDGANAYRIELQIIYLSPDTLYAGTDKPGRGQKIELARHLKQFPPATAILTTGAGTTHVQGHAIVLGPHPIAPNLLAHEFGHILGFRDRYVRGYRDLGAHGLQVLEVVADSRDIMAATVHGAVQAGHFLKLLQSREQPVLRHGSEPLDPTLRSKI